MSLPHLVERAYGLTATERDLWRGHPCLRDPLAVLRQRINALTQTSAR